MPAPDSSTTPRSPGRGTHTPARPTAPTPGSREQSMPEISAAGAAAVVAAIAAGEIPWTSTLIQEGIWTSDGRMIEPGALTFRDLPLTFMAMTTTADGHDGAQASGRIDTVERVDNGDGTNDIVGRGVFDGGSPVGLEAARLVRAKVI